MRDKRAAHLLDSLLDSATDSTAIAVYKGLAGIQVLYKYKALASLQIPYNSLNYTITQM